jgi:hypothetical protein
MKRKDIDEMSGLFVISSIQNFVTSGNPAPFQQSSAV